MINLFNTHIESLSILRVGNKSRNEALFLSSDAAVITDEVTPLLKEYFFKKLEINHCNFLVFNYFHKF